MHPETLRWFEPSGFSFAEAVKFWSGTKILPFQRDADECFIPVSSLVPTRCCVPFLASLLAFSEAHTTVPHRTCPQGAISMITLFDGLTHFPLTAPCTAADPDRTAKPIASRNAGSSRMSPPFTAIAGR